MQCRLSQLTVGNNLLRAMDELSRPAMTFSIQPRSENVLLLSASFWFANLDCNFVIFFHCFNGATLPVFSSVKRLSSIQMVDQCVLCYKLM